MSLAIGMVELNSIARGIETCDYMVKAAQIDLLRSSTVCPGKFLILIGGNTGDVRAAMKEGVLEFYSVASAITAADKAAKAANITLMEVHIGYAIGGKGYVTLTGDVGAVRAAVEAASRECELLVGTTVLPRPDRKLFESLL